MLRSNDPVLCRDPVAVGAGRLLVGSRPPTIARKLSFCSRPVAAIASSCDAACVLKQGILDMNRKFWAVAVAALGMSGPAFASAAEDQAIDAVIANLDLTSFPNSVGPRRIAGKTTFSDYGFVHIKNSASGTQLISDNPMWIMDFHILGNNSKSMRLCFGDRGLGPSGERAPSYNSTSALLVTKAPRGKWQARQMVGGFPTCTNNPPDE